MFHFSSIANKHVLKSLSRLGAGSFEYFDSSAKSKWEGKVKIEKLLYDLHVNIINILPLIEGVMVDYHIQKTNII